MKFTSKDHGLDKDGENMRFSLSFGGFSRMLSMSVEKGLELQAEQEAEKARKEEAARFNQFRKPPKR